MKTPESWRDCEAARVDRAAGSKLRPLLTSTQTRKDGASETLTLFFRRCSPCFSSPGRSRILCFSWVWSRAPRFHRSPASTPSSAGSVSSMVSCVSASRSAACVPRPPPSSPRPHQAHRLRLLAMSPPTPRTDTDPHLQPSRAHWWRGGSTQWLAPRPTPVPPSWSVSLVRWGVLQVHTNIASLPPLLQSIHCSSCCFVICLAAHGGGWAATLPASDFCFRTKKSHSLPACKGSAASNSFYPQHEGQGMLWSLQTPPVMMQVSNVTPGEIDPQLKSVNWIGIFPLDLIFQLEKTDFKIALITIFSLKSLHCGFFYFPGANKIDFIWKLTPKKRYLMESDWN